MFSTFATTSATQPSVTPAESYQWRLSNDVCDFFVDAGGEFRRGGSHDCFFPVRVFTADPKTVK